MMPPALRLVGDDLRCVASSNAGGLERMRASAALLVARMLRALRVPGIIRDVQIEDAVSGHSISITVGLLFTKVSVNGRDYFFRRLSGRLDGTGSGCS